MAVHPKSIYHAIYGDTDIWLLPKLRPLVRSQLVATFHEPPANLAYMNVDRDLLAHLDAIILVSNSQRSYFESIFPSERIFVVPHGVDTDHYFPAAQLGGDVCVTVGSHHRDFGLLKAAMDIVWQQRPTARLVAIGTRRENDPNPQFHTDDSRIDFRDGISDQDLLEVYHRAGVALCPLVQATANNAMLEAMACGLPVVSTDVGGVREYLGEDGGLFSQLGQPEHFAANILRVLNDRSQAATMSARSRARALEHDFRAVAKLMHTAYQKIQSLRG